MKPVGWTFQSGADGPAPANAPAPHEDSKSGFREAAAGAKGVGEAATAEEVESRINRILRIVQTPSEKPTGDDVHQRNGAGRGRDRKGAGKKGDNGAGGNNRNGGNCRSGGGGGGSYPGDGGNSRSGGGGGGGYPGDGGATASGTSSRHRGRRGGKNSGNGGDGGGDGGGQGQKAASWDQPRWADGLSEAAEAQRRKGGGGRAPIANDDGASDRDGSDPANDEEANRSKLNPAAAIFVPHIPEAEPEVVWPTTGYDEQGNWVDSGMMATDAGGFPQVVMAGEREFIGLQCIAEMGEWVVLRENKPQCLPFFWNIETGFKTWQEPESIKAAGIGELLKKWSVELPSSGIAPTEAAWPEPLHPQRKGHERRPPPPSLPAAAPAAQGHAAPSAAGPPGFSKPPGFGPPGFGERPSPAIAEKGEKGAGRRRQQSAADGPNSIAVRALQEATYDAANEDRKIGRGARGGARGNQQKGEWPEGHWTEGQWTEGQWTDYQWTEGACGSGTTAGDAADAGGDQRGTRADRKGKPSAGAKWQLKATPATGHHSSDCGPPLNDTEAFPALRPSLQAFSALQGIASTEGTAAEASPEPVWQPKSKPPVVDAQAAQETQSVNAQDEC